MPHRERAPQEVTPIRVEPANAAGAAAGAAAAARLPAGPSPRPAERGSAAPDATASALPHVHDAPPTMDEIERDVAVVRRRAFATAAYGVGAAALASTFGIADLRMWPAFALPAVTLTMFCSVATVAGTLWTWSGARRLGRAGISVFDAIDGAWRTLAPERAAPTGSARRESAAARRGATAAVARGALPGPVPGVHQALRIPASPAVLAGRWGPAVTRAAEDRAALGHLVAQLGPADREMIPDVLPTADMLVGRVGELASTLHDLDHDVPASLVSDVEARLAAARRDAGASPSPDQARRIELLERQHETLVDLAKRREHLAARLEGAALLLQNMRLDLLRLRSAGIDAALGELTSATREASALNRDIGRALDVAEELRKE